MAWLWVVAGSGWLVALAALVTARRVSRRLGHLSEQYWALKFEHGELKAKVTPPAPGAPPPQQTFVPLTRLRQGSGAAGSLER